MHLLLVQLRLAARAASYIGDLRPGFRVHYYYISARLLFRHRGLRALRAQPSVTTYEPNNNAPMHGDI